MSIFQYTDFRRFLEDHYDAKKKAGRGFSYRSFARRAGFSSPNYLKLVIEGKRQLSADMAGRFATACGLEGAQADFFCELVAFNQATSGTQRKRHYERLRRFKEYRAVHRLDEAHAAYHSEWYIPALFELIAAPAFREDPKWIARNLVPRIGVRQAEQALKVLLELGLLQRDAEGRLRQREPLLSTGDGPLPHHVKTFHGTMLDLAKGALEEFATDEREIASLTLCLSQKCALEFKQELIRFRRELLQRSMQDGPAERVIQINFQLFPLSRKLS